MTFDRAKEKQRVAELRAMPTWELLHFTDTLSTLDWTQLTEADYAAIAEFVYSDGCTGVPDFYRNDCIYHDWCYRTHRDLDGTPLTKKESDKRLKAGIRVESPFGMWSPMAWWRYVAVKRFGRKSWT